MLAFADRLSNVQVSASTAMTDLARELIAAGQPVISLSSGEPDFRTPRHIIDAAYNAALGGDTKYTAQNGTPALRMAIQRKFKRENHLDYALDEIIVGNGARQVVYNAIMATCNTGDEVIIPAPSWISYSDMVSLAGATPVPVTCPQNNGFRLRAEDLESAITPRTKWLLLNFPNNPTGTACPREDLVEIAQVMLRHPDIWIMTDDIYEHLHYDGFVFSTIAEVEPALKDRVLTMNGVSKAYAMTGWRLGYAGGPKALIAAMSNMQAQATGSVCNLAQAGAVAALDGPQDMLAENAAIYKERRDAVLGWLREAEGVSCHTPEGAFYVFPNIAGCLGKTSKGGRLIETDTAFVGALLAEKHVATVQGSAYGLSPYFRISYATSMEKLREGCGRIAEFCRELS
jgi:aspartate aminotransferase